MNAFVSKLLKAFVQSRPDLIERQAIVDEFGLIVMNEGVQLSAAANLRYNFVLGRIECRGGGGRRRTCAKVLIKYFESRQQAPGSLDGYAAFAREIYFFRTLLPMLRRAKPLPSVPKLYASRVAATVVAHRQAIVFEWPVELVHLNLSCDSLLGPSRLTLMVKRIAELHVAYWAAQRVQPDRWPLTSLAHVPYTQPELAQSLLVRCYRPMFENVDTLAHYAPAKLRLAQMLNHFGERLRAPFSIALSNRCWTLCHQNYGQHNVVFEDFSYQQPRQLRIFNWQSMGLASLAVDLVIVMFVESEKKRGPLVHKLIADYEAALQELPPEMRPSREEIHVEIKRCVPVALFVLASRVLSAQSQKQPDCSLYPKSCWNEKLVVSLFKFLIQSGFV
ncbi:hypothetical protein V9T40_007738 [Parthenolecanium corni]|uniref:CHK kinase-like domain-containing protein n=1 Tax=Parthenolecanium corni TaxID=536013 RepID=A0AAN9THM4_9HEMI